MLKIYREAAKVAKKREEREVLQNFASLRDLCGFAVKSKRDLILELF